MFSDGSWITYAVDFGVQIAGVLLLLILAWIVAGWAGRLVSKNVAKRIDPTLAGFFGNLTKYTILTLAILAALGVFGVDVTTFAAILAGAGLAIGLALQGTLSNFSAGVMLLAFRPFKVGDVVKVDGQAGAVHEIGLFSTALDTVDNRRVIVPNGNIFGATIENVTYHPVRRVDINVGTDYSADLKRVRAVLEQAAASVSNQLEDRVPQVFLSDLGDSSINWQVRVWCPTEKYWDVWQETTHTIKRALDDAGIGIPFPQMDVHLDRLDG